MEWQKELRAFKEKLAKRLWALPTVTETEKELVYKEYLSDLDEFEKAMNAFTEKESSQQRVWKDENELLRSLLGVNEDDLKVKVLELAQDKKNLETEKFELSEADTQMRSRLNEVENENELLRTRLHEFEQQSDLFRVQQLRLRENDIRFFHENQEVLKNQVKDLESRISNLRVLFADANEKYVSEKQEEITLLQKKLLEEMEATLRRRQEVVWAEEEMFAKGIAQRVRTTLVSAQGQLLLTLERLGLLDPRNQSESFWKARFRLLIEGAQELSENFRSIQSQLQEVTAALDDYLHLTNRRQIASAPVSLKEIVQREMAEIFMDRRPTLSVEFLSDDPMPDVPGDASLLKFVIHELLRNALEALPNESGQITVSLKNRSDQRVVQLAVRDSGPGVPEHLLPRLFQPFFSTKEHRQGLNLSRAKRYAEYHGGTLTLIQTGVEGTTFQIELPMDVNALHYSHSPALMAPLPKQKAG